ncbi:Cys-rich peptide radical SAM maturase CcpM [Gorillibacterium sp. sgz500922]|uniref:Cys-rich peptide radical SAM maturase CcpM n=1 Tax=Gorillibacterium sp. sgz500922 TaxID=3446694 RepID=UPI003F66421F
MSKTEPFIHSFKTPGSHYVYDVNRNAILRINPKLWNRIANEGNIETGTGEDLAQTQKQLDKLRENGFLSANRAKKVLHPTDELLENHLTGRVEKLTLQVTQQCNMRCEYCAYSGNYYNRSHQNKTMTFETAKKSIDFLFDHSRDSATVSIGFYGGEPLTEFDLVKTCIDYCNLRGEGKEIQFTLTTNGTLLNREIVSELEKRAVALVISLDGPKDVHDGTRKLCGNEGSFDRVVHNLQEIHNNFPDYFKKISINAVVNPENDFSCVTRFFNEFETVKDMHTMMSLIAGQYSKQNLKQNEKFIQDNEYEYFKIMLLRLKKLNAKHISRLVEKKFQDLIRTYELLQLTEKIPEAIHHGGPCIPGALRLFIDIEGNFFPCERVSETSENMKIGNIHSGFDYEKIRGILNIGKLTEERCKDCWSFRFCYLCAAFADTTTELSAKEKGKHCGSVRANTESLLKDICVMKELGYDFHAFYPLAHE